jgi:hypothetical protein
MGSLTTQIAKKYCRRLDFVSSAHVLSSQLLQADPPFTDVGRQCAENAALLCIFESVNLVYSSLHVIPT